MKIKTFLFGLTSDSAINEFLVLHEHEVEQSGMYVFSDRAVFFYDPDPVEKKISGLVKLSARRSFIQQSVDLETIKQRVWEAERGAASGKVKPDDVARVKNELNNAIAKADYLKEVLEK